MLTGNEFQACENARLDILCKARTINSCIVIIILRQSSEININLNVSYISRSKVGYAYPIYKRKRKRLSDVQLLNK